MRLSPTLTPSPSVSPTAPLLADDAATCYPRPRYGLSGPVEDDSKPDRQHLRLRSGLLRYVAGLGLINRRRNYGKFEFPSSPWIGIA